MSARTLQLMANRENERNLLIIDTVLQVEVIVPNRSETLSLDKINISPMSWNDSIVRYHNSYAPEAKYENLGAFGFIFKFLSIKVGGFEGVLKGLKYILYSTIFATIFIVVSGVDIKMTGHFLVKYISFVAVLFATVATIFALFSYSIRIKSDLFQSIIYCAAGLVMFLELALMVMALF